MTAISTYLEPIFQNNITTSNIATIFELGSRDLCDAYALQKHYNCTVHAFECNPDCIELCKQTIADRGASSNSRVILVEKAVCIDDAPITFYPFDLSKYDNMGSSSLLVKDFSKHSPGDPDHGRPNPQKEVTVAGTRIDTYCRDNNIAAIDMLCIDLQGYELNALKSAGEILDTVKYIITELSISPTYIGGACAADVIAYLSSRGFTYVCSTQYGYDFPDFSQTGYSEFDALFVRSDSL